MNAAARHALRALVLGACCALLARAAAAQVQSDEAATVVLDVPDCLGVSGDEVRRLVALELTPRLRVGASGAEPAIVGTVTCAPERVQIAIDDPQRAAPLQLSLDLAAAPARARARLLALSIAELIATSRLERAPAPAAAADDAAADDAAADDAGDDEPPPATRSWKLWAAPALSHLGAPALTLFGIDGGASYAQGPGVLLAELQARWGVTDTLGTEVAVQTYSAGLALSPRLSLDAFDFTVGPGMRLGYARLTGRPERMDLQGASLGGAWLGPTLGASVQYRIAPWGAVRAAFELGYVIKPVRGLDDQSRRLLELRGVWTSASFGAAVLL